MIVCMYCGERFNTVPESMGHRHLEADEMEQTFKALDKAAQRLADAKFSWGNMNGSAHAGLVEGAATALDRARAELDAIWNGLSREDLKAYGQWRKAQHAA